MSHDHHRGTINDSAVKALVTSPLFKSKTEKPRKGKGSYSRKRKSSNDGCDLSKH